jgi:hypothetical protein
MTLRKETLEASMWALRKAQDEMQDMLDEIGVALAEARESDKLGRIMRIAARIKRQPEVKPAPKKSPAAASSKKHTFSPAARKRIVAAQKKRWAAYHAAKKAAA